MVKHFQERVSNDKNTMYTTVLVQLSEGMTTLHLLVEKHLRSDAVMVFLGIHILAA